MPAFGAEVGAGFPPFFPPLDEKDSLYTLIVRARVRPARVQPVHGGRARSLGRRAHRSARARGGRSPTKYERLIAALDATEFHTLRRRAPVRLVVPRALRRLARATHAFGPDHAGVLQHRRRRASARAASRTTSGSARSRRIVGEAYLRAFERALHARGVPFAYAGGESFEREHRRREVDRRARPRAGLKPRARRAASAPPRGRRPRHDRPARPRARRLDAPARRAARRDGARGRAARRRARAPTRSSRGASRSSACRRTRSIPPTRTCASTRTTAGAPRVAFVMNPTAERGGREGRAARRRRAGRHAACPATTGHRDASPASGRATACASRAASAASRNRRTIPCGAACSQSRAERRRERDRAQGCSRRAAHEEIAYDRRNERARRAERQRDHEGRRAAPRSASERARLPAVAVNEVPREAMRAKPGLVGAQRRRRARSPRKGLRRMRGSQLPPARSTSRRASGARSRAPWDDPDAVAA